MINSHLQRLLVTLPLLAAVTLLAGCQSMPQEEQAVKADLIGSSHTAIDVVMENIEASALKKEFNKEEPILVTSFVNIDNVQLSSTLGRIIGEQVGARLSQRGYKVIEVKMRNDSIVVRQQNGEMALSRVLADISNSHNAQAVAVGTYAEADENIYITLKMIRASDNVILYSHNYSIPKDDDIRKMLKAKR
ncbi:MAG: hypothetical protein HQL49_10915 [Gammaproteobacteria bacterium]|nr:hypothetical protein [Gammaproteobacteria bacterium]